MKKPQPPLHIATPCPKQWGEMKGGDQRRFCGECQLHVHDLSAMSESQRRRFVTESAGRACITYELRPDGSMVVPKRFAWVSRPLRRLLGGVTALLAGLLPFLFTSCATDTRQTTLDRSSSAATCDHVHHKGEPATERLMGVPMLPPEHR